MATLRFPLVLKVNSHTFEEEENDPESGVKSFNIRAFHPETGSRLVINFEYELNPFGLEVEGKLFIATAASPLARKHWLKIMNATNKVLKGSINFATAELTIHGFEYDPNALASN